MTKEEVKKQIKEWIDDNRFVLNRPSVPYELEIAWRAQNFAYAECLKLLEELEDCNNVTKEIN